MMMMMMMMMTGNDDDGDDRESVQNFGLSPELMGIITRESFMIKVLEFNVHKWDITEVLGMWLQEEKQSIAEKYNFKRLD